MVHYQGECYKGAKVAIPGQIMYVRNYVLLCYSTLAPFWQNYLSKNKSLYQCSSNSWH